MSLAAVANPGRTRRLLANFGLLAGGRTMGAIMGLAAMTLAARALGAAEFGVVVMIHAAALMIRHLCSIRTSEAVIRYGVPLAEDERIPELKGLLKRIVRIDLISALLAAVVGSLFLFGFAEMLGLAEGYVFIAAVYIPVMLISMTGTAGGALRLLDRFGVLSTQLAIGPAVRLCGVTLLLLSDYRDQPAWYVAVWALGYSVEHLYTWWRALRSMTRLLKGQPTMKPDLDAREMRHFLVTVYWQSTLDAAPRQVATLLAGTLLGSAAAGLFSFARELTEILAKPVSILRQVVFPDLARLWRNDIARFVRVTWRTGLVTALVGLSVVVGSVVAGDSLLGRLAGEDFTAATGLLTLLLLAASVDLAGAALRPAGYVMGRARGLLNVQILATAVYLLAFAVFTGPLGLAGIGVATIVAAVVNLGGSGWVVQRGCAERRASDAA